MRIATTFAAVLSTLAICAGPAGAQEWSGVAGIAAMRGYSASPGMSMMIRPAAPPVQAPSATPAGAPAAADRYVASAPAARAAVQHPIKVASRRHTPRSFANRTIRPREIARAKRMGVRRQARTA